MKLEGYHTILGQECLSSCITNFFCYEGYALHTYDIPIIGEGLGMKYSDFNDIPEIHTFIYESCFRFLDRCKLDYQCGNLDPTDAISFLKESLAQKNRIVLRVNASRLPYNKAFRRGNVVQHFINFIGITEDDSSIKISDGCAPAYQESIFEDRIETEDLISAWSDLGFGYLMLRFLPDQEFCFRHYDSRRLFYREMKRNKPTFANKLVGKGICAISCFQYKLVKKLNNPQPLSQDEMAYATCNHIRIGGMLALKKMLYLYLADSVDDQELLNRYKKSVELWDAASLLLVKFAVSKSERDFVSIQNTFREIYELEGFCFKEIMEKEKGKKEIKNAK